MDPVARELVRRRARDCCEYCGLPQASAPFAQYHVEHIVARQHGGTDELANLALACFHCNVHKGPNLSSIDPVSGQIVNLFNPRQQAWSEHFVMRRSVVIGVTPVGRATANLLRMNAPLRQELRSPGGV